ncbi:hypothetical protein [Duganella levis]|uniref:DUF4404 family protein n=1 Tax=Duganella levis TaxID=2692169 RepID=A0ABW9VT69_9BURK|nr:hypothetical protein [Duganella levis]MYN24824.1 hypothetical protein [Duganella levis]
MEHSSVLTEFESRLDALKSTSTPDADEIASFRAVLDRAVEDKQITVREWRALIERCSHIRRTVRP